ncbi:MAG: hypothetical protein IID61_16050, partial [SAR324 cluster bacterium]|nr:hypothetical protein [SAR324 cluster bacterium]
MSFRRLIPGKFIPPDMLLAALIAVAALFLTACGSGNDKVSKNIPAPDYALDVTVTSLSGSLVLQNNGGDDLTITADGTFTFATALADGENYNVTIVSKPAEQSCAVFSASGTVNGDDVTDVAVKCSFDNIAPVADDFTVSVYRDTPVDITLTATDAEGDPLTFTVTGFPANGTVSGIEPNVTYTPDPGFIGGDNFAYIANDGSADSGTATVTVDVSIHVLYVDASATGANDGSTWANAFTGIQAAVDAAVAGEQVWVAEGLYLAGSTAPVLTMKDGVEIYGGFAGTEVNLAGRPDPIVLPSTLDGDVTGDGATADDSLHVVLGASNARLDGFTITGGNAIGPNPNNFGGGIYNFGTSGLILNELIISANSAALGGGMYNESSSTTLTNVTFSTNSVSNAGGGMYNDSSSSALTGVTFSGNSAASNGGGMFNSSSAPSLTNVTFSTNSAVNHGGGMANYSSSSPALNTVTFSANSADVRGGGMYNIASSPTLTDVIFTGNTTLNDGGGIFNDNSSPILTDVTFSGNSAVDKG